MLKCREKTVIIYCNNCVYFIYLENEKKPIKTKDEMSNNKIKA